MSDRKQALIKLRDKVKAGEWQAAGDGNDSWLAIFDAGLQPLYAWIYEAWDRNSLDAAKALHEAALPGWGWEIYDRDGAKVWEIKAPSETLMQVRGKDPARAWLLAIIEILIAQEADA